MQEFDKESQLPTFPAYNSRTDQEVTRYNPNYEYGPGDYWTLAIFLFVAFGLMIAAFFGDSLSDWIIETTPKVWRWLYERPLIYCLLMIMIGMALGNAYYDYGQQLEMP